MIYNEMYLFLVALRWMIFSSKIFTIFYWTYYERTFFHYRLVHLLPGIIQRELPFLGIFVGKVGQLLSASMRYLADEVKFQKMPDAPELTLHF